MRLGEGDDGIDHDVPLRDEALVVVKTAKGPGPIIEQLRLSGVGDGIVGGVEGRAARFGGDRQAQPAVLRLKRAGADKRQQQDCEQADHGKLSMRR